VLALERATPTRVANTMTVNPIAAGLLATLLVGEPITANLIVGLIAVFARIWIATTGGRREPVCLLTNHRRYAANRGCRKTYLVQRTKNGSVEPYSLLGHFLKRRTCMPLTSKFDD
jgi:hypothetical protein